MTAMVSPDFCAMLEEIVALAIRESAQRVGRRVSMSNARLREHGEQHDAA